MTRYLLPLIALVLLAAACGDDDKNTRPTITPTESAQPDELGTDLLGGKQRAWHLTRKPDDRSLEISLPALESCRSFNALQLRESNNDVTILIHEVAGFEPVIDCSDLLSGTETVSSIQLKAPLGDRRLRGCDPADADAPCDEVIPTMLLSTVTATDVPLTEVPSSTTYFTALGAERFLAKLGLGALDVEPIDWECPPYMSCPYVGQPREALGCLTLTPVRVPLIPSPGTGRWVHFEWVRDDGTYSNVFSGEGQIPLDARLPEGTDPECDRTMSTELGFMCVGYCPSPTTTGTPPD